MTRMFSKLKIFLLVILSFIVVSYIYVSVSQKEFNHSVQEQAPGSLITTSQGVTHYELYGNKDSGVVVLVHGLTIPYYIWDKNFYTIADAGFCVLRYDLFGRGFSDKPQTDYDEDLFVEQLHDLLQALQIKSPVHIVGLSMGGAIAALFTERFPEKVSDLVLISPAGFPAEEPFTSKLVKIPLLGDYIMTVFGNMSLSRRNNKNCYCPEKYPELTSKFEEQLRYEGYKRAILSTLRHMPLYDLAPVFREIGSMNKETLLLWGVHDSVVPYSHSKQVLQAIPHAEFFPIQGAGHNSNYEAPEMVNSHIITFLTRSKPGSEQ